MSNLTQTKQAYDRINGLLDAKISQRGSDAQKLQECKAVLDVAFYLLGWGQFEYLTKNEAKDIIETNSRAKSSEGEIWKYLKERLKTVGLRDLFRFVFFGQQNIISKLSKYYDIRNNSAHDYKKLPREVNDISAWLQELEDYAEQF